MYGVDCRGRGGRKVKRSVLFSCCLLPIWPIVHWRGIAQCVAVVQAWGGSSPASSPPHLVWLPLRAAAEAAECLLPFTSCLYFSLLLCPRVGGEKLEGLSSFPPPQAYRDLLGLQQAVALLFSLDLQRCTQSGFKLAVGFFFNLWIFLYFATALLSAGCSRPATNGLYFGLAGQATVFLGVRQVSLRKEAARRNMSVMLCRWEQNNFTMKLVGWTLPDHHKGQPPIRNQKTVYFSSWLCI